MHSFVEVAVAVGSDTSFFAPLGYFAASVGVGPVDTSAAEAAACAVAYEALTWQIEGELMLAQAEV